MHAKPQFRVYMMHDLGALRRARPTAIAVPLVDLSYAPLTDITEAIATS